MRSLRLCLLISLYLPLPAQQTAPPRLPTYPFPNKWVQPDQVGAPVALSRKDLAVIRREAECQDCGQPIGVRVSLGQLGQGTIFQLKGADICGATGNCPFYLIFHAGNRHRLTAIGYGWSFATVSRPDRTIDILTQANMSAGTGVADRFSYVAGAYSRTGCDAV